MANKELKMIMTDLAAGHITKEEVDKLIKPKKVENSSVETSVVTTEEPTRVKKTQKRKLKLNNTGG